MPLFLLISYYSRDAIQKAREILEVIAVTEEKKDGRGGYRPGAGRKKLTGEAATKQVQFRLTAEHESIVKQFVKMLKAGEITQEDLERLNIR